MRRLVHTERKEWVKKPIERQKERDKGRRRFSSKIQNAIWGTQNKNVRIGTKKGPNWEWVTLLEPNKVKEFIHKKWQTLVIHFSELKGVGGVQSELEHQLMVLLLL